MPNNSIRVLVWDEAPPHAPKSVYPKSINGAIADALNEFDNIVAAPTNIDDPDQGISDSDIANSDVIPWWGHARHDEVTDTTAQKVIQAVHRGMGFIALHSAHYSKTFRGILNCSGDLNGGWRMGLRFKSLRRKWFCFNRSSQ